MAEIDDGSRNKHLQLKITQAAEDWIAESSQRLDLGKADVVREALTYVSHHYREFERFVARRQAKKENG